MLKNISHKAYKKFCNFLFYELYFSVSFYYKCFTYNKKYTTVFPTWNQIFWCNFGEPNICTNKNFFIQYYDII